MPRVARTLTIFISLFCLCGCQREQAQDTPSSEGTPVAGIAVPPAAVAAPFPEAVSSRIEQVLGDPARYTTAIVELQRAVAAHDVTAVAAMVQFPLKVTLDGKPTTIADAATFALNYDHIVTAAIAAAVVNTPHADLLVNQWGIMFGNGEVWINGICADEKCSSFEPRVIAIQPVNGTQKAQPAD